MKILPITDVSAGEWDAACVGSAQAWLFHSADWNAIEERWFVCNNYSFAIADGDRLIALHPLYLSDGSTGTAGERLLHSGIHRHTGLALIPGLSRARIASARGAAMAHIFSLAGRLDVDRIQLNAHNLAPENRTAAREEIPFWVSHYGFHLGLNFCRYGMLPAPGMSTCNADQIVDLELPEEEMFAQLDQRAEVRKAARSGLEFSIGGNEASIDAYYRIAVKSSARTGESLMPPGYYHELRQRLAPSGCCVVAFAIKDAQRIAAALLLIHKQAATYNAGVSDPAFLAMRGNDFLQWSIIIWAKRRGLSHYRLGPFFPDVPRDWPIARVSWFKTKFGGRSVGVIQGSYFRHPEKYLDSARQQLDELCRARYPEPADAAGAENAA
jgi:hypothetical protein